MAIRSEEKTFEEQLERIEALVETVQQAPNPALRNSAEELVETLLELHGSGLERMLELIWDSGETGQAIIHEHLVEDDLASSLLLLHGLHPLGVEARVEKALGKVRPYLDSHGGDVELVGITDRGVVRLKLQGTCESCAASALTLKYAVEDAIYEAAPDVTAIETVEPEAAPTNGVEQFAPENGEWHKVTGLSTLAQGAAHTEEVAGRHVLFCRLNGDFYAYENDCPACRNSLGAAQVNNNALTCSHCGEVYDVVEAGRGRITPDLNLAPFPLLAEDEYVKVALPA